MNKEFLKISEMINVPYTPVTIDNYNSDNCSKFKDASCFAEISSSFIFPESFLKPKKKHKKSDPFFERGFD
jgi:hypothetical protein